MRGFRAALGFVSVFALLLTASGSKAEADLDPRLLEALEERAATERIHAKLDFEGPLSRELHRALDEAGIRLVSYRGGFRYYATIPGRTNLGQIPGLVAASLPTLREKLAPELLELPDPEAERGLERLSVMVEFYADVEADEAGRLLKDLGEEPRPSTRTFWSLRVQPERLRELAEHDLVKHIEPGPFPFVPLNEIAREASCTNGAQGMTLILDPPSRPVFQVDGGPIRIGIFEGGIWHEHADFDVVECDGGSRGNPRVYNARSVTGGSEADDPVLHATHVASIAAGSGLRSAEVVGEDLGPFERRGHAPYASIGDYDSLSKDDISSRLKQAIAVDEVTVTNHSYPESWSGYGGFAAQLDTAVRGDLPVDESVDEPLIPAVPQVWAAGNNRPTAQYPCAGDLTACSDEKSYYSVFTQAKNTISVGSMDTDGRLSKFSSLGPTWDGRIKPDLVAPGCRNYLGQCIQAASARDQGYHPLCGTSMAAPVVTGIIALMAHQYRKTRGAASDVWPSTYKALLIQTAEDQLRPDDPDDPAEDPYSPVPELNEPRTTEPAHIGRGPDFATGWGLVDAEAAVALIARTSHWVQEVVHDIEELDEYCIDVVTAPDGRRNPLRVTLAWDDLPGHSSESGGKTANRLLDDLDLVLLDPHGNTVSPWLLEPPPDPEAALLEFSDAGTGPDHRNNVERVDEEEPEPGTWRIQVTAYHLDQKSLEGTFQNYSLVSSRPLRKVMPDGECPAAEEEEDATPLAAQSEPDECKPQRAGLMQRMLRFLFGWRARAPQPPPGEIQLSNRTLDPKPGVEPALTRLLDRESAEAIAAIVQFESTPTIPQAEALARAGVEVGSYLGRGAYFAEIRPGTRLTDLDPRVRAAWRALPQDKVSRQLWREGGAEDRPELLDAVVYFSDRLAAEDPDRILEGFVHRARPYGPVGVRRIEIEPSRLESLAARPEIYWIEHLPAISR